MDSSLFLFVYGLSHHSALFDCLAVFFAEYSEYVWAAVLIIVLWWPWKCRASNRIVIGVSVVAALIARLVVKPVILFFHLTPRPFINLPDIHPLITTYSWEDLQSFPSGHALFFFALATALFCFNRKIGTAALVFAALMALARVYVGVHWPSDILGGAVLGIVVGWAAYVCYRRLSASLSSQA